MCVCVCVCVFEGGCVHDCSRCTPALCTGISASSTHITGMKVKEGISESQTLGNLFRRDTFTGVSGS